MGTPVVVLAWVAKSTYQPGLRFAGSVAVVLIFVSAPGVAVPIGVAVRLLRRSCTAPKLGLAL